MDALPHPKDQAAALGERALRRGLAVRAVLGQLKDAIPADDRGQAELFLAKHDRLQDELALWLAHYTQARPHDPSLTEEPGDRV